MAEETIKVGYRWSGDWPCCAVWRRRFTGGLMAVERINAAGGIKVKSWKRSNMMTRVIQNKRSQ